MAVESGESIQNISQEAEAPRRSFSLGRLLAWGGLFALLVVVGLMLQRTRQGPITVGQEVRDFSLNTFEGEQIKLSDLRGQIVVVNFWASWCTTCELEAADLETAWKMYRDRGVFFLGVDYVDTEPEARAYLKRFGITYPNGPDLGTRISQMFRTTGMPETYIIDREGKLAAKRIGAFTGLKEIQSFIDPLLVE